MVPDADSRESVRELTLIEHNNVQKLLMKRNGKDPLKWIEEHSDRFRSLIKREAGLRQLIINDPESAAVEIEKILEGPNNN